MLNLIVVKKNAKAVDYCVLYPSVEHNDRQNDTLLIYINSLESSDAEINATLIILIET